MTTFETLFEACRMICSQYTALDYDETMATAIETALGTLLDLFVASGTVGDYTIDAGATVTTAAVTQFGQVKVSIILEDAKTGGTETRIHTFGGDPVNARSHNT